MPSKLTIRSCLAFRAAAIAMLATLPLGCDKAERTGYLLVIRTPPPRDELPSSLSVRCLKPGGFCISDFSYPASGKTLSYQEGNLLARIAINVDPDFDKPRRLWVRARQGFSTLGEYAATLPSAVDGKQQTIDVMLQWGRLPDRDHDEVPDVIDDCPDKVDEDQKGGCESMSVNPDGGGTNTGDASGIIDTRSSADPGGSRVVDTAKG